MNSAGCSDHQLLAVWADQQAQEILLRSVLKTLAKRGPEARDELLAQIESEKERFASLAEDRSWRGTVTAVLQSVMDDVLSDLES